MSAFTFVLNSQVFALHYLSSRRRRWNEHSLPPHSQEDCYSLLFLSLSQSLQMFRRGERERERGRERMNGNEELNKKTSRLHNRSVILIAGWNRLSNAIV